MLRAANVIVVWRIRLLVSSFLTRNVGDEGPRTANSSTCGNLQVSVSTWYWQQGSNCQETVYNPQDMTAIKPSGPQMYGRSPQSIPEKSMYKHCKIYYLFHSLYANNSYIN